MSTVYHFSSEFFVDATGGRLKCVSEDATTFRDQTVENPKGDPRIGESPTMLVLSRHLNEKIAIGRHIVVTVVEFQDGQLRLGIEAPQDASIKRWAGSQSDEIEGVQNLEGELVTASVGRAGVWQRRAFGSAGDGLPDAPLQGEFGAPRIESSHIDLTLTGIEIENGVTLAWLRVNESVVIKENVFIDQKIVVTVIRVGRGNFHLGIDAPRDLTIGRMEIVDHLPCDDAAKSRDTSSNLEWLRVRAELNALRQEQLEEWGGIDEFLIARYLAGNCTPDEVARIEQGMARSDRVRDCIEMAQELTEKTTNIPASEEQPSVVVAAMKKLSPARRNRVLRRLERELKAHVPEQEGPNDSNATIVSIPPNDSVDSVTTASASTVASSVADDCTVEGRQVVEVDMVSNPELREAVMRVRDLVDPISQPDLRPQGSTRQSRLPWLVAAAVCVAVLTQSWLMQHATRTQLLSEINKISEGRHAGDDPLIGTARAALQVRHENPSLAIRGQIPKEVLEVGSWGCYPSFEFQEHQTAARFTQTPNNQLVPVPEIEFFARSTLAHWMQTEPPITPSPTVVEPSQGFPSHSTPVPSDIPTSPVIKSSPGFPEFDLFPTPPLDELIAKLERQSSPLQTWAVTGALQVTSCGEKFPFDKVTKQLLDWDEFGEAAASYVLTRNLWASIGNPVPATDREIEDGLMGEVEFLRWAALYSLKLRRLIPSPYIPQVTTFNGTSDPRFVSVPQRRSSRNNDKSSQRQSKHLVSMNLVEAMSDGMRESAPRTYAPIQNPSPVSSDALRYEYEEPTQPKPAQEPTEFERRMLMRVNELLASPSSSLDRRAAVYLVGDYGRSAWGCEANLINILSQSKSGDERRWAAFALGQMVAQTESTKEQLIKSLDDDDLKVRPAAAMALASILKNNLKHKAVDQARRKLKNMLTSSDPATQRWAAYALQVLSGKKTETREHRILKPVPDPESQQPPKEELPKTDAPKPADDDAPKA